MNFRHYEFNAGRDNLIRISLDAQANVKLLDPINFQRYKSGQRHSYYGGLAEESPVLLRPPHYGHWHVAIDLGGYAGQVNIGFELL